MLNRGSEWHRWEPHIHAPGTVLNDQFGGSDPWATYLTKLEGLAPKIEAIGLTDYYVTDRYEELIAYKSRGRIPDVQLIFPNIELRLDVAAKTGFVNLHLLVSPEDPNHLIEVKRVLKRLQFHAFNDNFDCSRDELIKLGKRADPEIVDDIAALRLGATQFKVNFGQLRNVLKESEWARQNVLIAVAGAEGDGTSGIRQAADKTVREEIEKFAHIIFSSSIAQREFWLGQRAASLEELRTRYDGCKPCLHGSDSHEVGTVGEPKDSRFTWIKGALEFDALRQSCIDPDGRAWVGPERPKLATPSQVISSVKVESASWAATPEVPLNSGLVAIIGARGSGKTALADVIAAGCDAIPPSGWNASEAISPSFLARARGVVGDATTTLTWGGGMAVTRALDGRDANGHLAFPRARYLSQQFVEELCSARGIADGLVAEIERVIFESHTPAERDGAIDFADLREQRVARFRLAREREATAISDISERISLEFEKEATVATLSGQVEQKRKLIAAYRADLAKLNVKGTEPQAARLAQLGDAAQVLRGKLLGLANQRRAFVALQDEVRSMRATGAPELLRQVKARYLNSGLTMQQWDAFLLIYKGDVDKNLLEYIAWADQEIVRINGVSPSAQDPNQPLIPETADLAAVSLATMEAEKARLESFLSADKIIREQYSALSRRIAQEAAALQNLEAKLADCQSAAARRKELQAERDLTYGRVLAAIASEQNELAKLYAPLMSRLARSSGTLKKLSFTVSRVVDIAGWSSIAEERLLDRRKAGPFHGQGSLTRLVEQSLRKAWETGSADEGQAAMTKFMAQYLKELLDHAPVAPSQQAEFRGWAKQFAQWLFGTDHISVRYEISYDGVDIRKLSPGTRGIVLLLLYLALDDSDDRPLIIDQPEENLDPKSVFDELVDLFVSIKSRRQVIIVTHNANLVINTDADQVIVAEAGPHPPTGLPALKYAAGGLESRPIRKAVCEILEGGEEAFRQRARRLRVRLDR